MIGAGPAGMAAAIQLHRAGHDPLVLERGECGGLLRNANLVENYPGFNDGIRGPELVKRISSQMDKHDIKVTKADVKRIERSRGEFRVEADPCEFSAQSVIVATGTRPKKLRLRGSEDLLGIRVFDELVDIPLAHIAGKHMAVIGGGDAAFDYALNLVGRGSDVTIISRSEPRCLSLLRARAEASGVDLALGAAPESIGKSAGGALLRCRMGRDSVDYEVDYVLIACGRDPNIEVLSEKVRKNVRSTLRIPETNVPGLYLAGDVVRGAHRQTAIAVGDGVRAAMLADEYLRRRRRVTA